MGNVILNQDVIEAVRHGIYVANMAYAIGKELGLSETMINDLSIAGLLHDIGKLKLSKEVEDDTMVIQQLRAVRMHSTLSYEILKEEGFSEFIIESIRHHHENYDGSGYPDRLQGEEIPFGARILRVCDVFIALTSDRAYRKAIEVEAAVTTMIEEAKNYDMKIMLAFLNVINSIDVNNVIKNNSTLTKIDPKYIDLFEKNA